jgi:hypothetical protein
MLALGMYCAISDREAVSKSLTNTIDVPSGLRKIVSTPMPIHVGEVRTKCHDLQSEALTKHSVRIGYHGGNWLS